MDEKDAVEVVLFAKQCMGSGYNRKALDMAVASLEVCAKLKEIGFCHNYQRERPDLVEWIDGVNALIRELNQNQETQ